MRVMRYLRERKGCLSFGLMIFLVTLIPYLMGFVLEGGTWKFSGFVFGVEDGNSYIAKMLLGANGDWLFRTPYTNIDQAGILAFFPYLLLGKLISGPGQHEQLIALFQFFRLVGIGLYSLAAYDFLRLFTSNQKLIRWGVIITLVGGGVGWLSLFGLKGSGYNGLPIDLYSPETFGFLSIFGLPHLAISRALLTWGWVFLFTENQAINSPVKNGLLVGSLWMLMGFFQPLSVVTAWAGMGGAWIIHYLSTVIKLRKFIFPWNSKDLMNELKKAALAIIVSGFWVIYNLISIINDSFLAGWSSQNIIRSPAIPDYLLGFSLILIPTIIGARKILNRAPSIGYFSIGYVLIFPLLAYFPINLQRRLPDGIWWVLTGLAIVGLEAISYRWRFRFQLIASVGILTSVFLFIGGIFSVQAISEPVYIAAQKVQAFEKIKENWNQPEKPLVLANYEISNNVPAWIYANVFVGHGPESINLDETQKFFEEVLSGQKTEEEILKILNTTKTDYIIFEQREIPNYWYIFGDVIFRQDNIWVLKIILADNQE